MRPLYWRLLKWGALGLSVGSVAVAALLMWLHGSSEIAPQGEVMQGEAETRVESPLIVERKGDRLVWRLQAVSATQEESAMLLSEPVLELFTEGGEVVPVRGRAAWFEPLKRNIHFKGDVELRYRQWILHCEELRYDSDSDQVVVPGAFRVEGPDVEMKGRRMAVDRKTEQLTVARDVWLRDERSEGMLK